MPDCVWYKLHYWSKLSCRECNQCVKWDVTIPINKQSSIKDYVPSCIGSKESEWHCRFLFGLCNSVHTASVTNWKYFLLWHESGPPVCINLRIPNLHQMISSSKIQSPRYHFSGVTTIPKVYTIHARFACCFIADLDWHPWQWNWSHPLMQLIHSGVSLLAVQWGPLLDLSYFDNNLPSSLKHSSNKRISCKT